MDEGVIRGIYIAAQAGAAMESVAEVSLVHGWGIEGDRYGTNRAASFSPKPGAGREVTLFESEAIEAFAREQGVPIAPSEVRRNIMTEGIRLNDLIGRRLRVGDAVLLGCKLCHPCSHLEKMTGKNVIQGLANRGGLRADIVVAGRIRVGDPVVAL